MVGHDRKLEHYGRTVTMAGSGSGPDQNLKKKNGTSLNIMAATSGRKCLGQALHGR